MRNKTLSKTVKKVMNTFTSTAKDRGQWVRDEALMLMMPISELKLIRKNINKQLRERAVHDNRY